ncbi:MAG: universal stress protein [Hyphomicrobiaceae bacterium]
MQTIMLASDLSARSDRALARAGILAASLGARLHVVHVVDEALPPAIAERMVEDAERALKAALAHITSGDSVVVDIHVVIGDPNEAILSEAEACDAAVIVLGQHRKDVLLDLFRGSTGERVARFGNRPVLTVKAYPVAPYLKMLAAIDFSPPCKRAIELAVKLSPDSELELIHAFDLPFRSLLLGSQPIETLAKHHKQSFRGMIDAQLAEFLASLEKRPSGESILLSEGPPVETILQAVSDRSSDLLVVGTHGRSGIGRALLGSVAEALIARAPCDVLAVRGW